MDRLSKTKAKNKHTETDRVDIHGPQKLDILIDKGPVGDKVFNVDVPGEGLLNHVGTVEPATATFGINELLRCLVDADNLGDVGLNQLNGRQDHGTNGGGKRENSHC